MSPCCELHNANCEPPGDLCCDACTEAAHPEHRDGSLCVLPEPFAAVLAAARSQIGVRWRPSGELTFPIKFRIEVFDLCGARTVFWPDDEACDAECSLPAHTTGLHSDPTLGEWSEDDMLTTHPNE